MKYWLVESGDVDEVVAALIAEAAMEKVVREAPEGTELGLLIMTIEVVEGAKKEYMAANTICHKAGMLK